MSLLLDEDYDQLNEIRIQFEEDQGNRFLVFPEYSLRPGLYNVEVCNPLVVIPTNYNDAGIDCIWVKPYLTRLDGKVIPQASSEGAKENLHYQGQEYCRWSRHWNGGNSWKTGISNIETILHRLRWAFDNPDADR